MIRTILLLASAALLTSCGTYTKLTKPDTEMTQLEQIKAYHPETVRLSFKVIGGIPSSEEVRERALAFGITDIIESEKPESGRLTLVIYSLETQYDKAYRYIGIPWSLVSFATLYLVPLRMEGIHPFEIHVIDPEQEDNKKLWIIHTDYAVVNGVVNLIWLPFTSASYDKDVYKTGRRRMLDEILLEVLKRFASKTSVADKSSR